MDDKLYFDPITCRFITREDKVADIKRMVDDLWEGESITGLSSPDYVDSYKLIELIRKHNLAVEQGFINDKPIWFDEDELRSAIMTYNDNVEQKFWEDLKRH